MATEQDDSDIPETGGVFTFGKSRFAENLPNKFWIRNDQVIQAACGDQHTILFAESGRVFVFGDNSYGQLGLGNTKPQTKPSCVKALKGEPVSVIGCGAYHTLVGTSAGSLFTFGQNTDHQCALEDIGSIESPTQVSLRKPIVFTELTGGSSHSAGLDRNGNVYVWGDNSEGQLGLGEVAEIEEPSHLELSEKAVHVSCGYYHTAVVTEDGKLYTFGESEGGKLGHDDDNTEPVQVEIRGKVVWASCGGKHTIAVTANGEVYAFGEGSSGQLGLGTSVMETSSPAPINSLKDVRIKRTACGENFTAAVTDKGQLYTFGDGRHGKLALGAENFSNQFRPFKVARFAKFDVTKVACGGCHTIALAHKTNRTSEEEESDVLDPFNSTFANSMRLSTDTDLNSSISARDRRRAKESPEPLSRTLPPLTSSLRGLPPLNSTYTTGKLSPLQSSALPNTLDKRKLPEARFSKDINEEDSDVSLTPEGSSAEDDEMGDHLRTQQLMKNKREAMKKQSEVLADKKGKPPIAKRPSIKPNSKDQREESEDDSEEESEEETTYKHTKRSVTTHSNAKSSKRMSMDSDEETTSRRRTSSKNAKNVLAKNKKNKKMAESDEEADSALDVSEEEEIPQKGRNKKNVKKSKDNKKKSLHHSDDEEESETEKKSLKKKKSGLSVFGKKGKKAAVTFSDDDDEEEEEPKPSKAKGKNKKVADSDEHYSEEEDEEEDNSKKKTKETAKNNKTEEKPPEEKKSRACVIL